MTRKVEFDAARFAENLRRLRGRRTQRELEVQSGVSNAYISQLETGTAANPSISSLVKLAAALAVPVDELLDGTVDATPADRRPCPFCGNRKPHVVEAADADGSMCSVICINCMASGPEERGPLIGDCTPVQRARAVARWNLRDAS